jgi:hypothetical protein
MAITFKKRQKEMKRQEKAREKAERRAQRKLAKRAANDLPIEALTTPEEFEPSAPHLVPPEK